MTKKLSRRDFLRLSASGTAGAILAVYGLDAAAAETVPFAKLGAKRQFDGVKLVLMYPDGEFTEEYRSEIKDLYGIDIEFLTEDLNRLAAMWAAGEPPDIWRANSMQIGPYIVHDQVLGLNDFVDTSDVVKWDDMQPAYKQHMFDGIQVGSGTLYGLPKDWGTDFLVYCFTDAFDEAGLEVPSDEEPLSYAQVFEMAEKLTKKEGDRTLRWGFVSHYWEQGPGIHFLLEMIAMMENGEALFADDMSSANVAGNASVKEVLTAWYEAAKKNAVPSALDPMPTWFGQVFTQGTLGMAQSGYWYGAMAESPETEGRVKVIPAPYWGSPDKRRDSSVWATATVGSSKTANPDAVWKVIEYYSGGRPAEERASTGWGVPLLKSMFDLLPQDTDFNKQRYKVLAAELPYAENALTFNPFLDSYLTEEDVNMELALTGELSLDEALEEIEIATNTTIEDGMSRL